MKLIAKRTTGLLIFILLSLLELGKLFSSTYSNTGSRQIDFQAYYQFLKAIAADSSDVQIEALKIYLQKHPDFERVYHYLLDQFLIHKKSKEAVDYFSKLTADSLHRRNSLWVSAKIQAMQGQPQAAFKLYMQALHTNRLTVLILRDFVKFDHANQYKFNGINELKTLGLNSSLWNFVSAFYCQQKYDYKNAIRAIKKIKPDYKMNVFALHVSGYCLSQMTNYSEAESSWLKGLSIAKEKGDLQLMTHFLNSLGVLKNRSQNYQEALDYLQSALEIAKSINDWGRILMAEGNLGSVYLEMTQYKMALQRYRIAINIAESLSAFGLAAYYSYEKANVLNQLKQANAAISAYQLSESYAQKSNKSVLLFYILIKKSQFYSKLNLLSLAKFELLKAFEWTKKNSIDYINQRELYLLADLLNREKRYAEAKQLYIKLLNSFNDTISPIEKVYIRWKLAECYHLEKDYESASGHFLLAFDAATRSGKSDYAEYLKAFTRLKLADIEVEQGRFSNALKIYQEALLKQEAQKNDCLAIERWFGLGNACSGSKNIEKAVQYYTQAAELVEENREDFKIEQFRIGYFSDYVKVYQALVQCYRELYAQTGDQQYLEKLYVNLAHTQARTLQDSRLQSDLSFVPTSENPKYQEYRTACTELQIIQRQIRNSPLLYDSLATQYEIARHNLLSKRLQLVDGKPAKFPTRDFSLEQVIESLIQLDMGLLFYHISSGGSFVLAANGSETRVIRLQVDPEALAAAVDSLVSPFHRLTESTIQSIPFHADIAHRLYKLLIKPVEAELALKKRLLIVPDPALMGLPFEMLFVESPQKYSYTPVDSSGYSAHFLLYRYSLIYSPGTWFVNQKSDSKLTHPGILVLANPFTSQSKLREQEILLASRSGWRFDMLWFADKEADKIDHLYDNVNLLKRGRATKASFFRNAMRYPILHFATHAFVDTVFDAFSGLVLATGEDSTDDGLLMGYEISDLHPDCDLVTLSACETGRGRLVAGEGVLGLPRLFLSAGANRVLMTQWKVNDKFTSELMPEFYNYFLNHGLPKTDALRSAKLDLMRQKDKIHNLYYQHPVFWASFSLYGTPGPLQQSMSCLAKTGIVAFFSSLLLLTFFLFLKRKKQSRLR